MQINGNVINDNVINAEDNIAETTLLFIEKDISLRATYSGPLLSIEKNIVGTITSSPLLRVGKIINNAFAVGTFWQRNGWNVYITLNGLTVDSGNLTGGVQVIKQADDNHTAEFTMILRPDIYDLYTFQGADVQIFAKMGDDPWQCVFTGVVDIPIINVFEEKLTLKCVADRRALVRNISAIEPYVGWYDPVVLSASDDPYDRLLSRMTTIPYSINFDGINNFSIDSWTPKVSPDFLYGSADVYRRNPSLTIESADKIINTVSIVMEYGFQRLHERKAGFVWEHTYAPDNPVTGEGGICPFLVDRPSIPSKQMILSAIGATSWKLLNDTVAFGKQFKSGSYLCSGVWTMWSTVETGYLNAPEVNGDGTPVNDSSGKPLYRSVQTVVSDNTDVYTMNAAWNMSIRFNQNIRESYSVIVQAPASVGTYGEFITTERYGFTSTQQFEKWPTSGTGTVTGLRSVTGTNAVFYEGDVDRDLFNNSFTTALNKANTTILNSHRDTRINFQRPLTPTMELRHTVALTGKWIRGKGVCNRIVHNMCISDCPFGVGGEAYTDVTLLQYRGTQTISGSALIPATAPLDNTCPPQAGVALQTHLGIDPSIPSAVHWNGYVGNIRVDQTVPGTTIVNHTRTNYQESFTVDTPAIPSDLTDEKINATIATYNVDIPTDSTEYESYG